jgi:hypothetical protein
MPGVPGNAGFPSVGVPSIVCQIIPGLCTNNNPESGAPYPWWLFPPITLVVNGSAAQSPQTPASGSTGNAEEFQNGGSWNISHPSPEVCGRVKTVLKGTAVLGGVSVLASMAFPPTAIVAEPVAGAAAINFGIFAIYYAAFCSSWQF